MMKKFIYSLAILAVAATSCTGRLAPVANDNQGELPLGLSFSFDTKASGITPVVNSIRIVAFDGNGQCVLNQLNTSGWTASSGSNGEYVITFDDDITMGSSTSMDYDIFAVLNEDGYILAGSSATLASLFGEIAVGSHSMVVFNSYFSGKAAYSATLSSGSEPAFLMGAYKAISIPKGSSSTTYDVEFDVMRRSLAQVTVTGISSTNATLAEAGIQIQEISLVNVPSGFAWGENDGTLGKNPVSIALATPGSDGFIARTSDGTSVSVTYSNISKTASTDDRMYLVTAGDGKDAVTTVSFSDISSATQYNDANKVKENAKKLSASDVKAVIQSYFRNKTVSFNAVEGTPSTSSLGTWSIALGSSYYIPENIAAENSTATAIKVRASLCEPGLQGGIQSRESSLSFTEQYTINGNTLPNNNTADFFGNNVTSEKQSSGKCVGYFTPVSYVATASNYTAKNAWKSTGHVYDFLIPINNAAFDSDYSVRRGTKYIVTLHVDQGTYDNLATKAGAEAVPFGISATVETEKMNGYED